MSNEGWVSIHRKIQDSLIWDSKEPFDKRSAWVDLILTANHKDNEIMMGSQAIVVHRGQRFTSVRHLAERWHWGKDKVTRYLDLLMSAGMIYRDSDQNGTLITITNYDYYQSKVGRENSEKNVLQKRIAEKKQSNKQETFKQNEFPLYVNLPEHHDDCEEFGVEPELIQKWWNEWENDSHGMERDQYMDMKEQEEYEKWKKEIKQSQKTMIAPPIGGGEWQ